MTKMQDKYSLKDFTPKYKKGVKFSNKLQHLRNGFKVDEYKGAFVEILSGDSMGEIRQVLSNDETDLIIDSLGTDGIEINVKYKIYWDFTKLPASEFNGKTIKGSNFEQEIPYGVTYSRKQIFPAGTTGVTFQRCNLNNVLVPKGNTMIDDDGIKYTNKKIQEQNDLLTWELDEKTELPVRPLDEKRLIGLGLSVDPKDIPATKQDKNPIKVEEERLFNLKNK